MKLMISTQDQPWTTGAIHPATGAADITLGDVITPDFLGFGGCFNELGWRALSHLDPQSRDLTLRALFAADSLALSYNRLPMGANDYATSWYSHAEVAGDFEMEHFSIARDHQALIPFIRAAAGINGGEMTLFASPWCPPIWLKYPQAYNFGHLIWDNDHRRAYALYFVKFIQAYQALGLPIQAVHVQNEPDSDQKFPSCLWTGQKLADFIRDDLAPAFAAHGIDSEIWLGTIERGSFNDWLAPTLLDPAARAAISGMGFQWAGKYAVQRARQAAPELPIIQTENECGDGENTWDYAHYVFDLMQHYLSNGASAYVYWNMVLESTGRSTWGWRQNSLFSVNPQTGQLHENPEYWLMRHVAGAVRPGDAVVQTLGRWGAQALGFRKKDGQVVIAVQNPRPDTQRVRIDLGDRLVAVDLAPKSFATLIA